MQELVVGTRGSALAMSQTQWVVEQIRSLAPSTAIRIEVIKTEGDVSDKAPLWQIGGQGLFVREIERRLLDGQIDLAVHSMKDLPSSIPEHLVIGAVPPREDPRDVSVSRHALPLSQLRRGARIGTSSARRRAQLLALRPDFEIVPTRGNVDSRLRKAETEDLDAVVLAAAGLARLGHLDRVTEYLDPTVCLPAVGQGALAIQARRGDRTVLLISSLDHPPTRAATAAERALLEEMGGGCQLPLGALCLARQGTLVMAALAASPDGSRVVRVAGTASLDAPKDLGRRLAQQLKQKGAEELLGETGRGDGR